MFEHGKVFKTGLFGLQHNLREQSWNISLMYVMLVPQKVILALGKEAVIETVENREFN